MTLTFTQENGLYVAEFEATAPFSIHLERPKGGFINMLQRSGDSGTFVAVKNFNPNYNATQVIDADCGQGAVYPKWIRLESAVEPSIAEVTFESESSGGGAGTESTMEYLDITSVTDGKTKVILYSTLAITPIGVMPSAGLIEMILSTGIETIVGGVNYVAISPTLEVTLNGQLQTISSCIEGYAAIPRITKEEFYSLEA